jgi:hypothetical protein
LFVAEVRKKQQQYIDMALGLLESIPAEKNNIIDFWATLKIKSDSAYRSQGLIELRNSFCNQKKCLNCSVGIDLLKTKKNSLYHD